MTKYTYLKDFVKEEFDVNLGVYGQFLAPRVYINLDEFKYNSKTDIYLRDCIDENKYTKVGTFVYEQHVSNNTDVIRIRIGEYPLWEEFTIFIDYNEDEIAYVYDLHRGGSYAILNKQFFEEEDCIE